jgi:hypothetical protein
MPKRFWAKPRGSSLNSLEAKPCRRVNRFFSQESDFRANHDELEGEPAIAGRAALWVSAPVLSAGGFTALRQRNMPMTTGRDVRNVTGIVTRLRESYKLYARYGAQKNSYGRMLAKTRRIILYNLHVRDGDDLKGFLGRRK